MMHKMGMKRILSFILAVMMCVAVAAPAFAANQAAVCATPHEPVNAQLVSTGNVQCGGTGLMLFKCGDCGEVFVHAAEHPNKNHDLVGTAADCTTPGKLECTECSYESTETQLGHNYVGAITTPASCTAEGEKTYTCTVCGDFYTEPVPMTPHNYVGGDCENKAACSVCGAIDESSELGHNYQYTKTLVAPTCVTTGKALYTCSACSDTKEVVILTLGEDGEHDYQYTDADVTLQPDCDSIGKANATCTICGATKEVDIPELGHEWDGGVETAAPSCTAKGETTYTCLVCGDTYTEDINELPHAWEDATCHAPKTCSVCGETEGNALDHVWDGGVANVTNKCQGGIMTYTCTLCGDTKTEKIDPEHTWTNEPTHVIEPTCTTWGFDFYACIYCGETQPIDKYEPHHQNPAMQKEVVEEAIITNADCVNNGLKVVTTKTVCKVCGVTLASSTKDEVILATGHTEVETITPATCAAEGLRVVTCSVCGLELVRETINIDPNAHDWKIITSTAPTCLDWGTKLAYCTRCNAYNVWNKQNPLPELEPLGHKWIVDDALSYAPDCENTGLKVEYCERGCVDVTTLARVEKVTVLQELGHNMVETDVVLHTCASILDGLDSYRVLECSNGCGLVEREVIDQFDEYHNILREYHTGNIVSAVPGREDGVLREGDCFIVGFTFWMCQDCGGTFHEKIEGTGEHVYTGDVTCADKVDCERCGEEFTTPGAYKSATHLGLVTITGTPASCTSTGLTDGKECTVCGEVITAQTEISVLPHTWESADCDTPKTCSVCGATEGDALGHTWVDADCDTPKTCSVCGATEGDALGHDYEDEITTDPTCTATGVRTYTCTVCGDSYTESVAATGHNYYVADSAEADCDTDGYVHYVCANGCGDEYIDEFVEELGHKHEVLDGKESTCVDTGLTDGEWCPVCGYIFTAQNTIPTKEHKNAAGDTLTDICTDAPTDRVCVSGCESTIGLTHNDTVTVQKAENCQEYDVNILHCQNCYEFRVEETTNAGPHDYSTPVVIYPTYAAGGYTIETCSVCGDEKIYDYTDALPYVTFDYAVGNGKVFDADIVKSGLVAVKVSTKTLASTYVNTIKFKLAYESDYVTFEGCEINNDAFYIEANAPEGAGYVVINAYVNNEDAVVDANLYDTANANGDMEFATLYFNVKGETSTGEALDFSAFDSEVINSEAEEVEHTHNAIASVVVKELADVDENGVVDIYDQQAAMKLMNDASGAYEATLDIDKDGFITFDDFSLIYNYILEYYTLEDLYKS